MDAVTAVADLPEQSDTDPSRHLRVLPGIPVRDTVHPRGYGLRTPGPNPSPTASSCPRGAVSPRS
ncbi:hypothetical protein [Streptomyces sp. NK08204]|uniref:hypothetical protein n=1 Tax=Streptomyces sp. NK08204 TaxID=2873260 RepID=UPI001CECC704|nr:hypothetical protein [Streptomyces sp. NK08204]